MKTVAGQIPGYQYGAAEVARSPLSLQDLESLKISAGFTEDDERYLRLAGEVLADQTKQIVEHWRAGIIAGIPNLARHSRTPEGDPIPEYLAKSNLRFQQWILDTCLRPYDWDWLDYQQEIALRHTSTKKNRVDGVRSTAYVPLRDIIAFVAVKGSALTEAIDKVREETSKPFAVNLWVSTSDPGAPHGRSEELAGRSPC